MAFVSFFLQFIIKQSLPFILKYLSNFILNYLSNFRFKNLSNLILKYLSNFRFKNLSNFILNIFKILGTAAGNLSAIRDTWSDVTWSVLNQRSISFSVLKKVFLWRNVWLRVIIEIRKSPSWYIMSKSVFEWGHSLNNRGL